jgi:plastocyanin
VSPRPGARLLTLATLLTLAASACAGGGSGGSGGDGQSTAPAASQTSATTATAGAAGGSGSCPAGSGLSGNIADHGAAAAAGSRLQVETGDSFFAPTCQTGVRAGTVTLVVHNSGRILHNLSVPGQGIDKDVAPGQTITVQVKMGGAALPFFCKYHRTSGMWGSLLPQG